MATIVKEVTFQVSGTITVNPPALTALVLSVGSVSLATGVSTSVVPTNVLRRYVEVFNPNGATPVFLGFAAAAVVNTGPALSTGQAWYLQTLPDFRMSQQEIRAIQASGNPVTVSFVEGV